MSDADARLSPIPPETGEEATPASGGAALLALAAFALLRPFGG